ncbi:MAG: hypothetical protein KDD82_15375 [Planctomycetes bacterium]|nr:hypothetical protein [Planctomycetota bacterium]
MNLRLAALVVCATLQLGCATVDAYGEPMPPHPGLAAVLELPGGGAAFSGDACARAPPAPCVGCARGWIGRAACTGRG